MDLERDFPITSRRTKVMRKIFGEGVRVIWTKEGGKELGRRQKQGVIAYQDHFTGGKKMKFKDL